MQDDIEEFLASSRSLNNDIFSLTRLELLILIHYSIEGVQFRELKATLGISDGNLKSNLSKLESLKYIERSEVVMDNKTLSSYTLTDQGSKEVEKIMQWMKVAIKLGEVACSRI